MIDLSPLLAAQTAADAAAQGIKDVGEGKIAATSQQKAEVIAESADLLFHLLVLWAERGIKPAEVYAELEKRKGVSGLDEKKKRAE